MKINGFSFRLVSMARLVLAIACIILGIIITPLPIPLGLLLISFGVILLAYNNKRVTRHIRIVRRKFPGFSEKLVAIESSKIIFVSEVLRRTNPSRNMHE